MAYSNTNRDKVQPEKGFGLKRVLFVIGLLIVIVSSVMNIWGKYETLKEARLRNRNLEKQIQKTTIENKQLVRQIEEATSSGYMARKAREYLGLGTSNDYWLILPQADSGLKLKPEETVVETKPNIIRWWELFTK